MWKLKYDINKHETETDSHREWCCGCQGEGGEGEETVGVWDQKQTIIFRMDKHKFLLCSTESYIQYPMINHNGKYMKKNIYSLNIYIYKTYKTKSLCCRA